MTTVTKNPSIELASDNLDRPIWGARKIAMAANIVDENGEPDLRRAFYMLERGILPASKAGRSFVTTLRRLRRVFAGQDA